MRQKNVNVVETHRVAVIVIVLIVVAKVYMKRKLLTVEHVVKHTKNHNLALNKEYEEV